MEIGREYVVPAFSLAYGDTYNKNVQKTLNFLPYMQSVPSEIPYSLLEDFDIALEYSKGIYRGPNSGEFGTISPDSNLEVLSVGIDQKPDCIVFYAPDLSPASYRQQMGVSTSGDVGETNIDEEGTIWVVLRGTNTLEDIMKDLSWIIETQDMREMCAPGDDFQFPKQVAVKAATILADLFTYVSSEIEKCSSVDSTMRTAGECRTRRRRIRRICFTGHSLGGALALALHVMYNAKRMEVSPELFPPSEAFTIGAPLLFHSSLEVMQSAPSVLQLRDSTHNIVFQLDPVPRLLGVHDFPVYVRASAVGPYIDRLTSQVDRTNYRPFGRFYCLRNVDVSTATGFSSSSSGARVDASHLASNVRTTTTTATGSGTAIDTDTNTATAALSSWTSDLTSAILYGERPDFRPTLERLDDSPAVLQLLATW